MDKSTVDHQETSKFSRLAQEWWLGSKFNILHKINPLRLEFIVNALGGAKTVLDVGCGGGLVTEPLARLGYLVTGIDSVAANIEVASQHAQEMELEINYLNTSVENLSEEYDAVIALEIIEHVNDPQFFIESCAKRLKVGGRMIISTLNKNFASWALGVVAAEYILRWVPTGTHDWHKFIRPTKLAQYLREFGLEIEEIKGINFRLLSGWQLLGPPSVNYIVSATKRK